MRRSARAVDIPACAEPLNDTRTAYFAGIIDGEAHVGILKNSDRATPTWNVPTIVISMTCRETILACASYFRCGCVHYNDYGHRKNPKHKPQWTWTIRWNDARRIAAMVRPFSITRRDALDRIINLPKQRSGPVRRFTEDQVRHIRNEATQAGSYAKLGLRFGIGAMTAWKIVKRKMYADVA